MLKELNPLEGKDKKNKPEKGRSSISKEELRFLYLIFCSFTSASQETFGTVYYEKFIHVNLKGFFFNK